MTKTAKVISRKTTDSELQSEYKWGFVTDIEEDRAPKGLNEEIVRLISRKKEEPEWMLDWRLKAYRHWTKLEYEEPQVGEGPLPEDRLPGHLLLRGTSQEDKAREPRRSRGGGSRADRGVQQAGHPA